MKANSSKSKIFTIISHEYMSRVKSKGFIIGTLIGPLAMLALVLVPALITYFTAEDSAKQIAVKDNTGIIGKKIIEGQNDKYFLTDEPEESLKAKVLSEKLDGYFLIPANFLKTGKATTFTRGGGGLGMLTALESKADRVLRHERLVAAGADSATIRLLEGGADISTQKVTEKGTEKDYAAVYAGIGYILGLTIYMLMFIYGSFVMRGVIEEKANRIVEVLASSAKPFEIMMGKILGIGSVGLTQVLVWVLIAGAALGSSGSIIQAFLPKTTGMQAAQGMQGMQLPGGFEIPPISPWLGLAFLFFFLIGYFLYSSLFAAIGSAVDQEQDAQQLQTPITLPLIIPILCIGPVINNPDGVLAIVLSLIPFFTPILMIVRIAATQVPVWQVVLSVVLTVGTLFGTIWAAARIYRVGILMYGKKPNFKDLFKWIRLAK